uniref:Uncharacterized protein n=2 Tax=Electrophorus electricus TaxID=8005 RepID=A0A4W4G4N0_ELEEL
VTEEHTTALSRASGKFGFNSPDYQNLTRLYCMNCGHHLQTLPDGTVGGTRDEK